MHKLLILLILPLLTFIFMMSAPEVKANTCPNGVSSNPACIDGYVKDGSTLIGIPGATVTITVGTVISPQFCGFAGQNGSFTAITDSSGYFSYSTQFCCNASSFSVSASAPNYASTNSSIPPPSNGFQTTYTIDLTPSGGGGIPRQNPDCNLLDSPPVCSGDCTSNGTCLNSSYSNGSQGGCLYTLYSRGGDCNYVPAPNQPCQILCPTGDSCISGQCRTTNAPPVGGSCSGVITSSCNNPYNGFSLLSYSWSISGGYGPHVYITKDNVDYNDVWGIWSGTNWHLTVPNQHVYELWVSNGAPFGNPAYTGCYNAGVSVTQSSCAPGLTFSLSPTIIPTGSGTNLTWTIQGTAQSCTISNSGSATIFSGSWAGTLGGSDLTPGSHTRTIFLSNSGGTVQSKNFTIYCSNGSSNTSTLSKSVAVNPGPLNYFLSKSGGTDGAGNITVTKGLSGSNTININYISGASQPVSLSVSGILPTGVGISWQSGNSCNPSCSKGLTISTSSTTPAGSYNVTVTSTSSGLPNQSTNFTLTVTTPNCNSGLSCGTCTLTGGPNTCLNNGTKSCSYTTYSGGGTCNPVSAPSQTCSVSNCNSGYSCIGGVCTIPPWIQTTGGDVHSNTSINTPGGP